jgi:hypothetical protein
VVKPTQDKPSFESLVAKTKKPVQDNPPSVPSTPVALKGKGKGSLSSVAKPPSAAPVNLTPKDPADFTPARTRNQALSDKVHILFEINECLFCPID